MTHIDRRTEWRHCDIHRVNDRVRRLCTDIGSHRDAPASTWRREADRARRRHVGERTALRRARRAGRSSAGRSPRPTIGAAADPMAPVAVISYSFWQRRFGGAARRRSAASLTVERVPFTIVGVAPPDFFGVDVGRTFDVAIPIGTEPLIRGKESSLDRRSNWWLSVMIRLKAEQSLEAGDSAHPRRRSRRFAKRRCRRTGARRTRTLPQGRLLADPRGHRRVGAAPALPPAADDDHGGRRRWSC